MLIYKSRVEEKKSKRGRKILKTTKMEILTIAIDSAMLEYKTFTSPAGVYIVGGRFTTFPDEIKRIDPIKPVQTNLSLLSDQERLVISQLANMEMLAKFGKVVFDCKLSRKIN